MRLKVGLVGAGYITRQLHLPVFKSLKDVQIAAICDRNKSIASEIGSLFGIRNIFDEFTEMLRKERLDIVDICTPPKTHYPLSMQAMESGCHVLTEKPLAMSVEEANKMISSSRKNGVKLCVIHQNLYNPAVLKVKDLMKGNKIGELLKVDVRTFERNDSDLCGNRDHWCHALPGGIFYEIAPHPIYLLRLFLKEPEVVCVSASKLGNKEWMKKDELMVSIKGNNGLGSIGISCNSLVHGDTLDILGSEMALRADLWGRTVITYKPHTKSRSSVGVSNLHLSLQLLKVMASTASTVLRTVGGAIRSRAHYGFISRFVESILKGTESPTTLEDGLQNVVLLNEICNQI